MHTLDELALAQSKCLVKRAVIKSPIRFIFTVRVDNENLIWNRPRQSLHERHIRVSVLICHARVSPVLNHTDTVDSALAQDAFTNLFGLCLVKTHPSCVAKAGRVYESESSVSDLNWIFYGIACLWLHISSSLIFFLLKIYSFGLSQKIWIHGFVYFSNVRKKVQKWCLTWSCCPQYQNLVVLLVNSVCGLENLIQDRARVFNFFSFYFSTR